MQVQSQKIVILEFDPERGPGVSKKSSERVSNRESIGDDDQETQD